MKVKVKEPSLLFEVKGGEEFGFIEANV